MTTLAGDRQPGSAHAAVAGNGGDGARSGHAIPRIGLYLTVLGGGGIGRFILSLATEFVSRGYHVDLVHHRVRHDEPIRIPDGVRLVKIESARGLAGRYLVFRAVPQYWRELICPVLFASKAGKNLHYFPSFVEYMRSQPPAAMIATSNYPNLFAAWAKQLTRAPTRLILTEHNTLSSQITDRLQKPGAMRWRYLAPLIGRSYSQADAIVAVSNGVADDLATTAGLPRAAISTIYNPIFTPELIERAREPLAHPWFALGEPPTILNVAFLRTQKDQATLLRAFARLRAQRPVRLLILGEGLLRPQIEALARQLGITADVALPGYVENPWAFMARASVFALSSRYEGFGNVLAEALACGCPVVSTDCPSGPSEILAGGRYGRLVPVGDEAALTAALAATLDETQDRDALRARGAEFSVTRAADAYLEVLLPEEQ